MVAATVSLRRLIHELSLVIAVEIAKRLGISPQRVNVLAGKLGRSSVWRWSSVERWARETGRLPASSVAD
jgi:hypothetical protein